MKIVIAYSGGLDTSVAIRYLKEKYKAEIIAYTSNIGQKIEPPDILEERAKKAGAKKFYYEDQREKFVKDYIIPALKAGAIYQEKYPLATSLSRPLIAEGVIKIAKKEKADAVSHGCTGKGNDQVRFELTFKYLAPDLKVIAPLREWEFKSREQEIEYAKEKGIPISTSKEKPYSIDENLWGISIECGVLENPWTEPPEDAYQITNPPEKAPDKPEYIEIGFEKGIFASLNDKKMKEIEIIERLTEIGARHGIGRIDMIEDRLVGIKSREIYEAPAAVILHTAHNEIEKLVFSRDLYEFKKIVSIRYSQLIYFGQWFSHLRECLDKFVEETQKYVTGKVRLKLYKGNCIVVGRSSPYSLYKEELATYTEKDIFDHKASNGFIEIFGLTSKLEGGRKK
ncbi:MAG: argininosuccinate synthase [Candidatus Omnitrophica bacterium]|nr:argininosuccinate synthase [Candidatus Omnitrophota bacterium]MCM8802898.1 argininosuccinate synthase [Candidatus Omnitrophota bacterium]